MIRVGLDSMLVCLFLIGIQYIYVSPKSCKNVSLGLQVYVWFCQASFQMRR